MFDVIRKDMPLKGYITTFECKLDNSKMDKKIKKLIDEQGDRQNHKTNVKANMTEWHMQDKPGFKTLSQIIINMAKTISKEMYNREEQFRILDMWGMKYKSGEYAIQHDHWPSVFSFVYYLNAPKNASGLFFAEMGEQGGVRQLEQGLLLCFPGNTRHEVKPSQFKGSRYVVSSNLDILRKKL